MPAILAACLQWPAANRPWWRTRAPLVRSASATKSTLWWGTSVREDSSSGTFPPSVAAATDAGTCQRSPAWLVSAPNPSHVGKSLLPANVLTAKSLSSWAASIYQRSYIRKHHHGSLYSVNNFRRRPEDAIVFRPPRHRAKRDRATHRRRRQWRQRDGGARRWAQTMAQGQRLVREMGKGFSEEKKYGRKRLSKKARGSFSCISGDSGIRTSALKIHCRMTNTGHGFISVPRWVKCFQLATGKVK